ncbi:MAG: extracellular solute-binding protein [Anaerolineae bacterium]|nr:extracellular solute-binding protein [Anaerolineae bacterium]
MKKFLTILVLSIFLGVIVILPTVAQDSVIVEFWTTDNEESRVDAYEAVAASFMAENPGIEVRIVPIDEGTISQRVATAVGANRLPGHYPYGY